MKEGTYHANLRVRLCSGTMENVLEAAADAAAALPTKTDPVMWGSLKVSDLKAALLERGLPTKGPKQQLVLRLEAAVTPDEPPTSRPTVRPGVAGIQDVATAEVRCRRMCTNGLLCMWGVLCGVKDLISESHFCFHSKLFSLLQEAAAEKVAAGEGRNVEHVAL